MQLQRIRIPAFRNLRDLDIAFASHFQFVAGAPEDACVFRSMVNTHFG